MYRLHIFDVNNITTSHRLQEAAVRICVRAENYSYIKNVLAPQVAFETTAWQMTKQYRPQNKVMGDTRGRGLGLDYKLFIPVHFFGEVYRY